MTGVVRRGNVTRCGALLWVLGACMATADVTAARGDAAATPAIAYVSWYFKPEAAFKRIPEYFGTEEKTGNKLILRSDPNQRAGLYFVLRMTHALSALPAGGSVEMQFIKSADPRPRSVRFALPSGERDQRRELWIGFTGSDAPTEETAPVSWAATVFDAHDKPVLTHHSFLWAMPPANMGANEAW